METDFLSQKLITLLPPKRKRTTHGYNIDCPMCVVRGEARPDTKQRCGIRTFPDGSLAINCFNCGFSTRWSPGYLISQNVREFLTKLGVTDLEIKQLNFNAWRLKQTNMATGELPARESSIFHPDFKEVELPQNSFPINTWAENECDDPDFLDVASYLLTRGNVIANQYEFYWTPEKAHNLNKRLIVPFYWNNRLVGWTGRSIDPRISPKYYTNTPAHFLFNSHYLDADRKYAILVEGQFDALAIQGVSTQGAKLSEQQAYWIKSSGKKIIVLPDRDEAGQKMIDLALQHDWMVSFPNWDEDVKDANDAVIKYGQLYTVRTIIDGATDNKIKINLLRKHLNK